MPKHHVTAQNTIAGINSQQFRVSPPILHSLWLGLIVFASAGLGLALYVVQPSAIPTVWPASGVMLAALLLTPKAEWPLLLISAGVAMGFAQVLAGVSVLVGLALALAHMASAFLAGVLVRRWSPGLPVMTRLRNLVGLVTIAAVVSNAFTSLLGATVVWAGFGAAFVESWHIWFVADGLSILVFAPLAICYSGFTVASLRQMPRTRIIEATVLLTLLLVVSVGLYIINATLGAMLPYPYFPLMIWAILRFKMRGISVAALFICSLSFLGTIHAQGPFVAAAPSPLAAILAAQHYLIIIVSSSFALAALISERVAERAALILAQESLRASEATQRSIFDSAAIMMGIVELIDDDILHISDNSATKRFFGMPADMSYPYRASAAGVHPEHIHLWRAQYAACAHSGAPVTFEYEHIGTTGPHILTVIVSLIDTPTGKPQRFAYFVEDITERKRTEAELRVSHDNYAFLASHDSLTGMLNRRAITTHGDAQVALTDRGSSPLSMALLDIDHFKAVNDQHGHLVGDEALLHITKILLKTMRCIDSVGRWGGEEFLVVMANTPLKKACMVAETLRVAIEASPLHLRDESLVHLTVSIGVACTDLQAGCPGDQQDIFRQADDAMYTAKRNGRNRISSAIHGELT